MKPVIYTSKEDAEICFLADDNSGDIITGPGVCETIHYFTSVRIGTLRPGPVRNFGERQDGIQYPHPAAFSVLDRGKLHKQSYDGRDGMECPRDIYRESAIALLTLAAACLNIQVSAARKSFTIGEPIRENFDLTWDKWKFITAWRWSEWKHREIATGKKITLHDRWGEMSADGYPHGESAFEKMHRALFKKRTN